MLEKRIESILQINPELIDPRFKGREVETQTRRGKSRLDLMVRMPRGAIIVEIKKVVLSSSDVKQVLDYCRSWALHPTIRILHETYLIGYQPLAEEPLCAAAEKSVFKLHLRYLGKHIPKVVQEKNAGGYERWDEDSGKRPIRIAD